MLKQGIKQITGDLIIDTSVFASHDKAPGWPWNDLTQCFSAQPGAAIVDRNCFSVSLYSARTAGEPVFIPVASYYPVHMFQPGAYPGPRRRRGAILRARRGAGRA